MKNKKVEVCDKCLKASCWYGEFMCEESQTAGTVIKTIKELIELKREDSHYWSDKYMEKVYGDPSPFGYVNEKESKYEYSFKGKRINHCYECPLCRIGFEYEYCDIDGITIECSDITRPVNCPLVERKCDDCI